MYIKANNNNKKETLKKIDITQIKDIIFDDTRQQSFYKLQLDLLLNKKNLIINDIDAAEFYITSSPASAVESRASLISGVNTEKAAGDVINGELARAIILKRLFQDLNVHLIDQVDLTNIVDNTIIKKVKSKRISDVDAFGKKYQYVFKENKKELDKLPESKKNKKNVNYLKYANNVSLKRFNTAQLSKKLKKFNDLGLDIISDKTSGLKKFIGNKKLIRANMFDQIDGRFSSIQSHASAPNAAFNLIENCIASQNSTARSFFQSNQSKLKNSALNLQITARVEETLSKVLTINTERFGDSSEITIFAVLFSKGIKREIKFSTIDISNLLFEYNFPNLDFDFSIIKERKNNFIACITNNEKVSRKYIINCIDKNKHIQDSEYTTISELTVPGKTKKVVKFKKSENKNYRFVASCMYDNKIFANSKIASYRSVSQQQPDKFVKFYCLNLPGGIEVQIDDVENYNQIEVIRKNLTNKARNYTSISKENITNVENYKFLDASVEDKNVYEYKIKVTEDSSKLTSSNSFIEKFCKKKSIVNVNSRISSIKLESSTNYELSISFARKITMADKLVNSLLGNYYSLFEDRLKSINQQNQIVYDTVITAFDLKKGVQIDIANVQSDEKGNASVSYSLPSSDYIFKISPRILLPDELITVLLNSPLANLPNFDAFLNQETGDIDYVVSNSSQSTKGGATFKFINSSVKEINKNKIIKKEKTGRIGNKNAKFLASFDVYDPHKTIDYFVFSYSINNSGVNLYDLAVCVGHQNNYSDLKTLNFAYNIPAFVGTLILIAQPVTKTGEILSPFVIGNVNREK
jgi:hypothetical protein